MGSLRLQGIICSLPEFLDFKLGKIDFVVNSFFGQPTQEMSLRSQDSWSKGKTAGKAMRKTTV